MAGVPLVAGTKAYFGFMNDWEGSSVVAFDLKNEEVIWEKSLGDHQTILKFPPTTDGKKLYIRNLSHLLALDLKTGDEVWNTKLTGKEKDEGFRGLVFFSAPVIYKRSLYLFRDEYLIPYRPNTGETNYNSWRRYLGSIGLNAMEAGPPPIICRNRLYTAGGLYFISGQLASIGGDPGGFTRISSYDMAKKRALWEIDTGHASVDKMTLGGKFLVTADFKGKVLCLSSTSGEILWGSKLEGGVRIKPVVFFGRAYFATDRGMLYCLAL
jgi:outer membrane protein assembly factor BamB